MSIAEEMEKLIELHVQGRLSEDEFNQAKHELLTRRSDQPSAPDVDALSKEVEYLRLQNEINRLDLDWERERKGHQSWDPYGKLRVRVILSWVMGIGSIIAGVAHSDGALYLVAGMLLMILGLMESTYWFSKVSAGNKAEQHYQERRRQLSSRRRY